MFDEGEIVAMESWVLSAQEWSEASQGLVGAAASLALSSRTLADELRSNTQSFDAETGVSLVALQQELRTLANTVEDESASSRDAYLATAARIATSAWLRSARVYSATTSRVSEGFSLRPVVTPLSQRPLMNCRAFCWRSLRFKVGRV